MSNAPPAATRTRTAPVQALRQIMVQNYHRDAAGHLRWCTGEKEGGPGLPFSSRVVVSLYDTSARYARHGHIISWKGFSAHLTETCAPDGPDVITHVLARPLPDLLTHRGPADRGQVHQKPVPALPGPHSVHHLPRSTRTVGSPHENSATCNFASAPSNRHPSGRPATRSRSGVEDPVNEFTHGYGMRRLPLPRTRKGPLRAPQRTASNRSPVIFFTVLQEGRWPPGPA
jgi:hypothetical protein